MKVRDLMTSDVKACSPNTNLAAAAGLLWEGDFGALPVVDSEEKFVGMITDRDICMAVATQPRLAADILVSEIISGAAFVCHPGDDIQVALNTMQKEQVRRLPIVNDEGKLQGILSTNDLVLHAEKDNGKAVPALSYEDVINTHRAICEHRPSK